MHHDIVGRIRLRPASFSARAFSSRRLLLPSFCSPLFVSTLAALCPRLVDINPGQGGKNVCFGHVRSSAAREDKETERREERGKRRREKARKRASEDVGSTTLVSRSLIFRYCLFSPRLYFSLAASLFLSFSLSPVVLHLSSSIRPSIRPASPALPALALSPARARTIPTKFSHLFSSLGWTVEIVTSERKRQEERER